MLMMWGGNNSSNLLDFSEMQTYYKMGLTW